LSYWRTSVRVARRAEMILKSSSREVQQTTRRRPKASIPMGNEAAFAGVRVVNSACPWILEDRGGVGEIDAVSSQVGTSFLGIPLEGHEPIVCTIVHTRKCECRGISRLHDGPTTRPLPECVRVPESGRLLPTPPTQLSVSNREGPRSAKPDWGSKSGQS
jgi:hypothetical protein